MTFTKTIYTYDYSVTGEVTRSSQGGWFEPQLSLADAQRVYHQAEGTFYPRETRTSWTRRVGIALLCVALGGMVGPLTPVLRLESGLALQNALMNIRETRVAKPALPPSVPVVFEPLTTPDGASISPVSEDFSLIIPKVGINAQVIANVNPSNPAEYTKALKTGVAHASTSFLPDQNGTVYIFSHSTNYDWFVKDLNAVFYHLKNLNKGDVIVLIYKGNRYTYKLTDKKVVKPRDISYLVPDLGKNSLILQTCWPPGSVAERLLIFADLVKEQTKQI